MYNLACIIVILIPTQGRLSFLTFFNGGWGPQQQKWLEPTKTTWRYLAPGFSVMPEVRGCNWGLRSWLSLWVAEYRTHVAAILADWLRVESPDATRCAWPWDGEGGGQHAETDPGIPRPQSHHGETPAKGHVMTLSSAPVAIGIDLLLLIYRPCHCVVMSVMRWGFWGGIFQASRKVQKKM